MGIATKEKVRFRIRGGHEKDESEAKLQQERGGNTAKAS
jgi:hypothetical protein